MDYCRVFSSNDTLISDDMKETMRETLRDDSSIESDDECGGGSPRSLNPSSISIIIQEESISMCHENYFATQNSDKKQLWSLDPKLKHILL